MEKGKTSQKNKIGTSQVLVWVGALLVGALLGLLKVDAIGVVCSFIATVYTRLFQFLAVPTVALAILTTLLDMGRGKGGRLLFGRTLTYTLLTTFAASLVGLGIYLLVSPEAIPAELLGEGSSALSEGGGGGGSFMDHIISVIPNNILAPILSGNVLSLLLIAAAFGLAISRMAPSEAKQSLINVILSLQEVFLILIRALIWTLPLGIAAFAQVLVSQLESTLILGSLGKWTLVILTCNVLQVVVVLPLFLLCRGINPLKVFKAMSPALLMALFTKSSAATLPLTLSCAQDRLGADGRVAKFVLPICTTINMNGCAAFILVTSLFVMKCGGMSLSIWTMLLWVVISVFAAVGNAGVPMGCFFLTLSLMTGMGAPVAVLGLILPIYTIVDMVETAENVWSDSCVCAMTDKDLRGRLEGVEK